MRDDTKEWLRRRLGVKGLRVHFLALDVGVARGVRTRGISRAFPNTARLTVAYITRVPYFDKRPLRRLALLENILISENQRVRLIEFRLYIEYLISVLFLPCSCLYKYMFCPLQSHHHEILNPRLQWSSVTDPELFFNPHKLT